MMSGIGLKYFALAAGALAVAAMPAHAETVAPRAFGSFKVAETVASLPETSEKIMEERRLIDNATTGVRVFRVYKAVPRHHHKFADTYLQVLSGKAEVAINGGAPFEAGTGDLLFWRASVDHEVVRIIEEPLVFLAFDSPVRRKGDVTFFDKP